jgi:CBS domain-containing protein
MEACAMKTVKDILNAKGSEIVSIGIDAMVVDALVKMSEKNIGAILVLNESGKLAGIFSERDLARKIIIKGRSCDMTKVKEIMTPDPWFVELSTSMEDCLKIMTARKFRHLPVKDGDELVGVVSIGDVVKAYIEEQGLIISAQAFEIGQMERTIPGAI